MSNYIKRGLFLFWALGICFVILFYSKMLGIALFVILSAILITWSEQVKEK
jgi:hypothetical protein